MDPDLVQLLQSVQLHNQPHPVNNNPLNLSAATYQYVLQHLPLLQHQVASQQQPQPPQGLPQQQPQPQPQPQKPTTQQQNGTGGRPQPQTAPKYHFVLGKCAVQKVFIIGVKKPFAVYFYEYDRVANAFFVHSCSACQPAALETYINPYYAEYDKETRKKVLFARNTMTCRVEQFVYSFHTNTLTQVWRPKLVYDAHKYVSRSNVVAFVKSDDGRDTVVFERTQQNGLRKLKARAVDGMFEELPETQVNLLAEHGTVENPAANVCDYKPSPMERAYFNYIAETPNSMRCFQCPHTGPEFICIFNKLRLRYYTFWFNEQTGAFAEFHCNLCAMLNVSEACLMPKYMQPYRGQSVIHVHNVMFSVMEQYVYDGVREGFEQVYYPELKYDPAKDAEGYVISVEEVNGVQTVIMRDVQNRIHKEYYSDTRRKFIAIQPAPVLTFLKLRDIIEADNKEKDTPDIIDLGVKNPLADQNGVVPPHTNLSFGRAVVPKHTQHVGSTARVDDLTQEVPSTSGVGWHPETSSSTSTSTSTGGPVAEVQEEEEGLTRNQKKKLKKKAKKAREAAGEPQRAYLELIDPATGEFYSMHHVQEQVWALGVRLKRQGVLSASCPNPKPEPNPSAK